MQLKFTMSHVRTPRVHFLTLTLCLTGSGSILGLLPACNGSEPGPGDGDCEGALNCACYGNDTCNGELVCVLDICEDPDGGEGGADGDGDDEGEGDGDGSGGGDGDGDGDGTGDGDGSGGIQGSGGRGSGGASDPGSGGNGTGATQGGDPIEFDDPLAGTLSAKTAALYSASNSVEHSCISTEEGQIYCWGNNNAGQLGNGTDVGSTTPVQVSDIETAEKVVTGAGYSCALLSDGSVRCWGDNNYYHLGTGDLVDAWEPVTPTGLEDVVDIAARSSHSCAVREDGDVLCWGWNGPHLGYTGIGPVPKVVPGLAGDALAVAVGGAFSCALIDGGAVQCWGDNGSGQLGHGDAADDESRSPVSVVGIDSAVALSSGASHTCALIDDGTVWCWGSGYDHQLGKNAGTHSYAATRVIGIDDATSVGLGLRHSCATRANGKVSCWGRNDYGEAGSGTTTTVLRPWDTVAGIDDAVSVWAGTNSTCAVLDGGAVQCWGSNESGRLALGDLPYALVHRTPTGFMQGGTWFAPYEARSLPSANDIQQIVAASHRTCLLRTDGSVACWGDNADDLIGDGSFNPVLTPTAVSILTDVAQLADFGSGQICARKKSGVVQCVGIGVKPVRFDNAIDLTHGYDFGCAIVDSRAVSCFGNDFAHTHTLSRGAIAVSAGSNHMCAALDGSSVHCWGFFDEASLGSNQTGLYGAPHEPSTVEGVQDALQLAAGLSHTCALLRDGTVHCWGANAEGQLGDGSGVYRRLAADTGLSDISQIASGWYHSCAVTDQGMVYCWGDNASGQIGDDEVGDALAPARVVDINDAVQVSCSMQHSCVLHADGAISCWGNNERGELGDGTKVNSPVPVQVVGL